MTLSKKIFFYYYPRHLVVRDLSNQLIMLVAFLLLE